MKDNSILDITKDIKWIGVTDPDIRVFDIVMKTGYGSTYNSYFINAEKKTIVDTAKFRFWDTYEEKLRKVVAPEEIKYIIVNHTEPDHSGSLIKLLKLCPEAVVVGSGNAIRYLNDILNVEYKSKVAKDGEILDLGNKKLKLICAPNLHWPDSIFTYAIEDKVFFSCDVFGCHYCDEKMFDDKVGNFDDAFSYYFDVIFKPFSKFMLKGIEKIRPLDISVICPGHGPILRKNWKKYVDLSEQYSREYLAFPKGQQVFIPYVSAYNYTGILAEKIAEGIRQVNDIKVDVCDIQETGLDVISDKLTQCTGLIVGSPTINQNTLLQIYQLFAMINPVRDRSKLAAAFGSYGWSGESADIIEQTLKSLKFRLFPQKLFVKLNPSEEDMTNAVKFGRDFADNLLRNRLV
jgi:NADH oxidase (H2O-forming)